MTRALEASTQLIFSRKNDQIDIILSQKVGCHSLSHTGPILLPPQKPALFFPAYPQCHCHGESHRHLQWPRALAAPSSGLAIRRAVAGAKSLPPPKPKLAFEGRDACKQGASRHGRHDAAESRAKLRPPEPKLALEEGRRAGKGGRPPRPPAAAGSRAPRTRTCPHGGKARRQGAGR